MKTGDIEVIVMVSIYALLALFFAVWGCMQYRLRLAAEGRDRQWREAAQADRDNVASGYIR
jgi:hypothetical protein